MGKHKDRTLAANSYENSTRSGVLEVTLNELRIGIDEHTGNIVRMEYPGVGVMLEAPPQSAGVLDVAYPIQECTPLRLASRFSRARIERQDNVVIITWDALGASRSNVKIPEGKVTAQVKISAAPDGRSVIFKCRIDNQSKVLIPQVLFPDFWGLKPIGGEKDTRLQFSSCSAPIHPFIVPAQRTPHYWYPHVWQEYTPVRGYAMILRWFDLGGYNGGLSVFEKAWQPDRKKTVRPFPNDLERTIRTFLSELDPMSLRLVWDYKKNINPAESWESEEFWVTPHRGGWAKGIEVYRDYVRQKHPPRQLPKNIRDSIGFQSIWMIEPPETDPAHAYFRFTDIPRIAEDAKKHGITEICIWNWCHIYMLPFRIRTELGTRDELLKAISDSRKIGVNVNLFISCLWQRNEFAERYGEKPGGVAWLYHHEYIPQDGNPYYLGNEYPVKFFEVFDMKDVQNKVWQADVKAAFKEWMDLGLASWCFDVFRGDSPEVPGLTRLMQEIRRMALSIDPESTFSAEICRHLEFGSDVLDYNWNWTAYSDIGPLVNVLRTPRFSCNVEASPLEVKKGFIDNMFLNIVARKPDHPACTALISEKPDLSSALKEVAVLRRQFLPYFVDGVFIGDSVRSRGGSGFVKGYQLGDRLLVFILNEEEKPSNITVRSDLSLWLPKVSSYIIKNYNSTGELVETADWKSSEWVGTTKELKPFDMTIFEIQARGNK